MNVPENEKEKKIRMSGSNRIECVIVVVIIIHLLWVVDNGGFIGYFTDPESFCFVLFSITKYPFS